MRSFLSAIFCLFFPLIAPAGSLDDLAGKRVLILGDSITQAGGWVSFTSHYLHQTHPDKAFQILSLGLASETLSGLSEDGHAGGAFPRPCLFERLPRVLGKTKPETIIACYGMNDGIFQPLDESRFAAFRNGVQRLITETRAAKVARLFLVTPPIYDSTEPGNYDTVLTAYAAWETTLREPGVEVIDLHSAMRQARGARSTPFSSDHVHPGDDGHLLMATTILKAFGITPPAETPDLIRSSPLFQQIDVLRGKEWGLWMNHTGYTRERHVPPQPLHPNGVAETEDIRRKIASLRSGKEKASP
jgi:lysophospholipase L1-like esterase